MSICRIAISAAECFLAFAASIATAFLPPSACASSAVAWALFLMFLGGYDSFIQTYVAQSFTVCGLSVARIVAAGVSLAIAIRELVLGPPALAWPIIGIACICIQLLLAAITLLTLRKAAWTSIVTPSADTHLTTAFCPCETPIYYSWSQALAWFVAVMFIMAESGCARSTRPILSLVVAPTILLAHAGLYLDKRFRRCDALKVFSVFRSNTRKQSIPDRAAIEAPGFSAFFALVALIIGVSSLLVPLLFPLINVCLTSHPAECTFARPRLLLGLVISAGLCFAETGRFLISLYWLNL